MADRDERARVGIRELRQNLSIYVDRVKEGETLEVTEHGHVVAQLGPLVKPPKSLIEEMMADGRMTRATRPISELPEPVPLPPGVKSVTETLLKMREEERY